MKKITILLFSLLILSFASCEKYNENLELEGTEWVDINYGNMHLSFGEETFIYRHAGTSGETSLHGTYNYDFPNIILEITTEDETSETWLGIIQDDNSIDITTIDSVFKQKEN